nr:hypothetical protein [Tanacetum cinerariifolium]
MDLLQKHGMVKCDTISTPMATVKLDADLQGTQVDQTKYHSMIGGLMYLTASRPNIAFATFDSGFELIAYSDTDLVGCNDDCKSTSGGIQFLRDKLVNWSSKKQDCTSMSTMEAETVSKVIDIKDTIKFMLDTKEFTYTVDMFRVTLHLPVETPKNPFVAPINIQTIEAFMNKKFLDIPQRVNEDYHSIKDDTLLKEKKDKEIVMEKDDDDDVEKVDKGVKEKSNADVATGSTEFRKEKIHCGQICFHIKHKFIIYDFFIGKILEVLDHCNKVVPELTFAKTNEMINKEMPRLANLAVNKDRKIDLINSQEMVSKEFAIHAPK